MDGREYNPGDSGGKKNTRGNGGSKTKARGVLAEREPVVGSRTMPGDSGGNEAKDHLVLPGE